MDRPYLVLIQPQIHDGAVERSETAVGREVKYGK